MTPNPTNVYSTNIGRRQDGLHAFVARAGVYTWKNAGEIMHATFPNVDQLCHATPWADFAGDKLVLADIGVGVGLDGPMMIGELDLNTMEMSPLTLVGNNKNRYPVVRGLSSGGCVVTSYTMETTECFDISYRSPFTGQWSTQRHFHQAMSSIPASCWTIAQGTDGLVYVFAINDASCCLQLYRFAETVDGLVFVDEDTHFIDSSFHNGVQDPLSLMAELPELRAQTDHARGRIVLACQKWPYTWECGWIQSQTQIIAIYPDKRKELVGNIEHWSGHGGPSFAFPRPEGIYYALTTDHRLTTNPVTCENFERFLFGGFLANGKAVVSPDNPPCHPFMAVSFDGWVVRRIIDTETWIETFELGKLPLPPQLKIKDNASFVEVSWDQQTISDTLESSGDLISWIPIYTGLPPLIISKSDGVRRFLRVSQPIE